jgi:uncharacterized membrane protein YphA (DoxX/SURF4 family)
MRLPLKPSDVPARVAAGAFILNSGLTKLKADEETAGHLHGMACGAYPFLRPIPPPAFTRLLAAGELAIGAGLLLPVVPTAVAGAGLAAFSAALVGLYLRTPGTHEPKSLRPTQKGIPLAKDFWLLGMGLSLVAAGAEERRRAAAGEPPAGGKVGGKKGLRSRLADRSPKWVQPALLGSTRKKGSGMKHRPSTLPAVPPFARANGRPR